MNKRTFLGSLAALCATGLGLAKEKPISRPKFNWVHSDYLPIITSTGHRVCYNVIPKENLDKSLSEAKKMAEEEYTKYFSDLPCACFHNYNRHYLWVMIVPLPKGCGVAVPTKPSYYY